jgi:hypothetical protein
MECLIGKLHPYLGPQKVSKNPQTYFVYNTLPKSPKSHFDCLRPLGDKDHEIGSLIIFRILTPNLVHIALNF